MRVKPNYYEEVYGEEIGALMLHINEKRAKATGEQKALYKRVYTWLQRGLISPEDKQNIDAFIDSVYAKFKAEHDSANMNLFRFERKNRGCQFLTLDNVVFIRKGERK